MCHKEPIKYLMSLVKDLMGQALKTHSCSFVLGIEGQVLALPKGNQLEIQHDNSLPDKGIWKYQLY